MNLRTHEIFERNKDQQIDSKIGKINAITCIKLSQQSFDQAQVMHIQKAANVHATHPVGLFN